MKVFFRRASISVFVVLLSCWPAEVVCQGAIEWLENTDIPRYVVVALGGLLLVTIVGCSLCLWCTRRRRKKEFFTNDPREGRCDDSSWEMIPSSTKEAKKDSQEPDRDSVTIIKISLQSNANTDDKKCSGEATTDHVGQESHEEEQKHQTQPDSACAGHQDEAGNGESFMPSATDTPHENSIDGTNDKKHDESENADNSQHKNSDKPKAEPVYAQVNRSNKKKVKSGYSIVYAELADFDKNKNDNSLPRNTPSTAEYAEIARLTKSPRDMCPLDD